MPNRSKLLIVVTEDWFFVSHFLSVATAAIQVGFDVAVVARVRDEALAALIVDKGIRLIRSRHERGTFGLMGLVSQGLWFARLFRHERPDILHLVSLRLIVLAGTAAAFIGLKARVQAVTGLGLIGASSSAKAAVARHGLGALLRGPLAGRRVRFVFENRQDPVSLGMDPDGTNVTVVGGAGIDPAREVELPMPPLKPLKIAVVGRMVQSKGIDVAVDAVRRARAAGADAELSLFGAPDPDNPRALAADLLTAWSREPGIAWHGHTSDIPGVWREHHVVCVPSRGGEGLPRSLLEGAAAGRAVLTTLTPGCATFARDGVEGFVVPPDDAAAMADAIVALARNPARVETFGHAARARVLEGFTADAVARDFLAVYRDLLVA